LRQDIMGERGNRQGSFPGCGAACSGAPLIRDRYEHRV
jgi:hypothetical protein